MLLHLQNTLKFDDLSIYYLASFLLYNIHKENIKALKIEKGAVVGEKAFINTVKKAIKKGGQKYCQKK